MNPTETTPEIEATKYLEGWIKTISAYVRNKYGTKVIISYAFDIAEAENDRFATASRISCEILQVNHVEYLRKFHRRNAEFVLPRMFTALLMNDVFDRGPSWLGRRFRKNHSSVIHMISAMKQKIEFDFHLRDKYLKAKKMLMEVYEIADGQKAGE